MKVVMYKGYYWLNEQAKKDFNVNVRLSLWIQKDEREHFLMTEKLQDKVGFMCIDI